MVPQGNKTHDAVRVLLLMNAKLRNAVCFSLYLHNELEESEISAGFSGIFKKTLGRLQTK